MGSPPLSDDGVEIGARGWVEIEVLGAQAARQFEDRETLVEIFKTAGLLPEKGKSGGKKDETREKSEESGGHPHLAIVCSNVGKIRQIKFRQRFEDRTDKL